MDNRLCDLYQIPDNIIPQDIYMQDLSEHCAHLEERVRDIIGTLPDTQRQLIEAYIEMRDELEFQSVKLAIKYGKLQK